MTRAGAAPARGRKVRLRLRANAGQFALLMGVNGLVGALVGQDRLIVPLLGQRAFGVATATAALAFVVAFGMAKAITNPSTSHSIRKRTRHKAGWNLSDERWAMEVGRGES